MKLLKAPLLLFIAALAATLTFAAPASAQLIAYDDAGNYLVSANWTNGANQGFGFMPWVMLTNSDTPPGGSQGWFITVPASYANASITNVGGTNYSCAWGLYANGSNAVNETVAFRGFASTLGTNTFKLQWGARESGGTTIPGTGAVNGWSGFTLRSGNATNTTDDFETGVRLYVYFRNGNSPSTIWVWDGNGVQSVPGTSFSNLGRDSITNALEAEVTPAADGSSYHLVLKDVVANQTLATFDGVFIGGPGTEDSAAMFDQETQSPGDQIYNRMQIAIAHVPPEIVNVQPTNGSVFLPAATPFSFEVDSFNSTVATNAVSVYLNGVLQDGLTYNTTLPANQLLGSLNPTLADNTFYTFTIVAQDANGNSTSNSFAFNTFESTNTCIQAEDYNYGAGQFFPSPTPLEYANLLGTNGIDYLDVTTLTNLNNYRPDYTLGDPPLPQLIPATDTVDHDLYVENGIQDYQLAYTDAGEWDNYTRAFPGTPFTLYARAASATGGSFQVNLLASPTATTTNQPLAALGTCSVPNTGGSTVYGGQLVPVADLFGNPVVLALSGMQTLQQAAISSRGYNLYYLMLVPAISTSVLTPYISAGAPAPGASGVGLVNPISFTIANRQTAVVTNTIKMLVNNTNVTGRLKMITNAAGTMVSYIPTNNYPPNFTNTITVVFSDNTGTNSLTNNWSFVTAGNGGITGSGLWSGGGGLDLQWSTAANWTGGTPGPGSSATFASPGATTTLVTNNIVSTNVTIVQLNYQTNNSGYHTTFITNGVTLTVTNGSTVTGTEALQVGSDIIFNPGVTNTITGGAGTLMVLGNPTGSGINSLNFQIRQCASPAVADHVVLDMSGLGTLVATVGKFTVGQGGSGAYQSNCTARVSLARTNIITLLRVTSGVFVVGDSSSGAYTLPGSTLNLGVTNSLYFDTMNVGKQKVTNALVRFNPAFTNNNGNPFALLRDTNGPTSRLTEINVGDVNSEPTVPVYNSGTMDLSGGTLDALIGIVMVGRGSTLATDTGSAQGTFTMTAGTLNVTNLQIGVQRAANTAAVTGSVNINGTALLICTNPGVSLAQTAGGSGPTLGTLNITNGTALANIVAGGGTSMVNLNGGTLMVASSVGTPAAPLTALNLTGGSLQLNVNGTSPSAIVNATSVTASGTTIAIGSITNVTGTTPITLHLINYTGSDPYAGLTLGALPPGFSGSLVDHSGSIDLSVKVETSRPPTIGKISLGVGGQLVLSGTNNSGAGGTYHVLASTNLTVPLTNWVVLTNGSFDASGNFSSTNAVGTNNQQFYILQEP
jgi:hypothetical protein